MRKVVCLPKNLLPNRLNSNTKYFITYGMPLNKSIVGYFAHDLKNYMKRNGIVPSVSAWDFNTIALSVVAADKSLKRSLSADGWTREIQLDIHLVDPKPWYLIKSDLAKTLQFLTGDLWEINFLDGGTPPPTINKPKNYDADSVSLLSGGVDSLVGGIDLVASGKKPILLSQTVRGNAVAQQLFASRLVPDTHHFQISHKLHCLSGESEDSTRARSITFFSFAAMLASYLSTIKGHNIDLVVPENGFISLNPPLNTGRIGSFSTKTTHPVYMAGLQKIWNAIGLDVQLISPYQFQTKGEMLSNCLNTQLLKSLIADSTSCGKFGRNKMQHCGRCVPCMVRRAAFLSSGFTDNTIKGYTYQNIATGGRSNGPNDIGAMAAFCLKYRAKGIDNLVQGSLSFADPSMRNNYLSVIERGIIELEALLKHHRVL